MKTLIVAAAILAASSGVVSAGAYVGLGIGTGPDTTGDVTFSPGGRSSRLVFGYSFNLPFGTIAVEAAAERFGLMQGGGRHYDGTELFLAGKYSLPLGSGFEAFGRLGLQRTSLTSSTRGDSFADASGSGRLFGAGFEYRLKLSFVAQSSLFVDYTLNQMTLDGPQFNSVSATTRMWMLGATVGF